MKKIKDLIKEFSFGATMHYKFSLEGNYKQGNIEIKKINKIYDLIKMQNGLNELLELIHSDVPEVSSLAATYCMKFNPEKCLSVLEKLSEEEIPLISFSAKHAIENWKNNKWYID